MTDTDRAAASLAEARTVLARFDGNAGGETDVR
jgi:hypothetical protein